MGCNSNCFINCDDGPISDQCVQYTGPDVPALGICTGDQLSTVEVIILQQLQLALIGTGITPDQVTLENCLWLKDQFVGQDPNLSNLLQLLIDSSCNLKEMIDTINTKLTLQNSSFNTMCLQGLPTNPNANDILQSAINTLCALNSVVAAIPATYVKNSDLNTLVQQQIAIYLSNTQSGTVTYSQYVPIGVGQPYFGPLSNFDNTGLGIVANGFGGYALCNGLNGTLDLRGKTLVGAVRNVPGGTLDSAVDPSNPDNPNWTLGDTTGENKHGLTITEIPAHGHPIVDPGHRHNYNYPTADKFSGNNYDSAKANVPVNSQTSLATTGITIGNTGGGQKHNNIQPSIAVYWIVRIS